MAKETIPFLGKTGVGILWKQMKDYYANALRGDETQLETSAKTVVGAINELYSKVDSIVNAPKITTLSITGESIITSAGDHTFTAVFSPGVDTVLIWGIEEVGRNNACPVYATINPISGKLKVHEGTVGDITIFVIDALSEKKATFPVSIDTTVIAESITITGYSTFAAIGTYQNFNIQRVPEDASTEIIWELVNPPYGWSVDAETGRVMITYDAEFYGKRVILRATDLVSSETSELTLSTISSDVEVYLPADLTVLKDGWYNHGETAPKSIIIAAHSRSCVNLKTIEANALSGFTNSAMYFDVPTTVTSIGKDAFKGMSQVSAYHNNSQLVKDSGYTDVILSDAAYKINITGLKSEYTEAGTYRLGITKTPEESYMIPVWSFTPTTLGGVSIDSSTGELTIGKNYLQTQLTVRLTDRYSGIWKEETTILNTAKLCTDFEISVAPDKSSCTIIGIIPEDAYYSIEWKCDNENVELIKKNLDCGLRPKAGFQGTVSLTARDSISGVEKSVTVELDARVPLRNLAISGPTNITSAGNYTYSVTYTKPSPENYHELTISCDDSDVRISSTGVLTVPERIKKSVTITVEDSISGLTKSIAVAIDTTSTLTLTYDFADPLPGNAGGIIRLSTTSLGDYGNYEIYYGDEDGIPLANYQAINYVDTVTNTSDNDNIPITLKAGQTKASFDHFIDNNALPMAAKTIVACKEGTTDVLATYPIPEEKLTSSLSLGQKMYSIGMISDIHVDGPTDTTGNDGNADLDRSIKWFRDYGVAAVCSAGDVTDDGEDNQWQAVQTIITRNNLRTALQNTNQTSYIPFYISAGNHDARRISTFKQYTGYDTYNVQTIGGDIYIFCGLNKAYDNILSDNYNKLSTDLEKYKNRNRVFVFQHVPIPATNGNAQKIYAYNAWTNNSDNPYATNQYSDQFASLMKKYNNVILINGHSHLKMWNQVFDKKANYYRFTEGGAHMLHLPSLTYPREWQWDQGTGDYTTQTDDRRRYNDVSSSEACVLDVYEKGVIFRSFNCEQQKFIGIAEYKMETRPQSEEPEVATSINVFGETEITEAGDYTYRVTTVPTGVSTNIIWTCNTRYCTFLRGVLTVPEDVEENLTITAVDTVSEKFSIIHVTVNTIIEEEPLPTEVKHVFHINKELDATGGTGEGWYINAAGTKITDTKVTASSGNIVNKFVDASLVSDANSTGKMRTLTEWTGLFFAKTSSNTTSGSEYQRAFCDSPVNFNGGINADYWPGSGWVVNVMNACVIGANPGPGVITGDNDSTASYATNVSEIRFAVKRNGDVFQYTTDGVNWETAVNRIQDNSKDKSFTVGGTGGSGAHPFYGKVECDIYDSSVIDPTIISTFFGAEIVEATGLTITGETTISKSGRYTYLATPTPISASTRITWRLTGSTDCTITSAGVLVVPNISTGISDLITITATDTISGQSDNIEVAVETPRTDPSQETSSIIMYVDRNYSETATTYTNSALGQKVSNTGWWMNDGVPESTLAKVSGKPYQDKLPLASISATSGTSATLNKATDVTTSGTVITLDKWTMLVDVQPGTTGNNGTDHFGRAICDVPNAIDTGITVDAYGTTGMTANLHSTFYVGTGEGITENTKEVKAALRRDGTTLEYSLDGIEWRSATANFNTNTGKVFSLAGTNSGNDPYTGYLHVELYEECSAITVEKFFQTRFPLDGVEPEPEELATALTISGSQEITKGGQYKYTVTPTPGNAITSIIWSIKGESACSMSKGTVTVPSPKSGLVETLVVVATDTKSGISEKYNVSINIPETPDQPGNDPSVLSPIFYVDRNYTSAGVTSGYTDGEGWYLTADGTRMETLKKYTNNKWSDKFDTSLISQNSSGSRFLEEWTMLTFVETTANTPTTSSDNKYTRALCDTPNNYPGGMNIDYYPGSGWVVNVMRSCVIGTATEFAGTEETTSATAQQVDGNQIKLVVKRNGNIVQYSTDNGSSWKTATNNFQANEGKVLTLGGTNSVNNPFYGHVKCAIYNTFSVDSGTIAAFFNEEIKPLEKLIISGKNEITSAGTYKYTVAKEPLGAIANVQWEVAGIDGVTVDPLTGDLVVPTGKTGTLTLTVKDTSTNVIDILSITVNTVITTPDPEVPDTPGGGSGLVWELTGATAKTSDLSIAAADGLTQWTMCVHLHANGNQDSGKGLLCGDNFKINTLGWNSTDYLYTKIFGTEPYGQSWQCNSNKVSLVSIVIKRNGNTVTYKKASDSTWTTISSPTFGSGTLNFTPGNITWSKVLVRLYDSVLDDSASEITGFFTETASDTVSESDS